MKKVYIVLSRSNTIVAHLVRTFTRKYYTHASIAFEKDLNSFYSFGRKNPKMLLPAGFINEGVNTGYFGLWPETKIRVLEIEVDDKEFYSLETNIAEFENHSEEYRYNILGLVTAYLHIKWSRPKHYTCSGFVAYCMRHIFKSNKHYSLTQPEDFYKFNFKKIYEGTAGDYHYEKQQVQC